MIDDDWPAPSPVWRKSSRSGAGNNNCVQVAAFSGARFGIRDSKAVPDGPILLIGAASFHDFIAATKAGVFDLPPVSAGSS